ncbi:SRPBCC domain-containing protein [Galbitalea sp. SE-J8]|uniref:SRPBCC domain-containing protein n=1 Tax=Galbitalea sp. SE-J8 TaxID=3054952 RepID=UPI00259CCC83|nr:SRPBCC domain-containing protein [Galbitalea sp. SE-J8]MDM4761594.1 SRPBCC domain-containing protein [Galbitalea sp. SE-J8]
MSDRIVTSPEDAPTILFTREFDAPPALVFRAHVDETLVPQWIGPRGTTLAMRHWDARTGGSWSYVVSMGHEHWGFFGSFHSITPDTRIVQTFEFDDEPDQVNLDILGFAPLPGGRCLLTGTSVYPTIALRDAALGLDEGRDEDFARLDDLLAGGIR